MNNKSKPSSKPYLTLEEDEALTKRIFGDRVTIVPMTKAAKRQV